MSGLDATYQSSKVGILATPRLTRPLFIRKTNSKTNQNKNLSFGKHGKTRREEERYQQIGPQCVQNEPTDWNSCSEISASGSFVGFYSCNKPTRDDASYSEIDISQKDLSRRKDEDVEFMKSIGQGLQANRLLEQEAGKDNIKDCLVERCRVQGQSLKSFAALYVSEICKVALSILVKERSKAFAKEYVANVIRLANCKFTQLKNSKTQTEKYHIEEQESNMLMDEIENPSFSKVWKNSGVFSGCESRQGNDYPQGDRCIYKKSNSREEGKVKDQNDFQFEEFLEKKMVDSLESLSSDDSTTSSSNSSRQSVDVETREKGVSSPRKDNQEYHDFNNDLMVDCTLKKTVKIIRTSNEIDCATRNQVSAGNVDIEIKEMRLEESKKIENTILLNDALNLGGRLSSKQESENTADNYRKDEKNCRTERNSEDDEISTSGSDNCFRQRPPYKRTMSESQASDRKQWSPLESDDGSFSFHSSALSCMAAPKYVRSASCPVISEVRDRNRLGTGVSLLTIFTFFFFSFHFFLSCCERLRSVARPKRSRFWGRAGLVELQLQRRWRQQNRHH